MQRQAAGMLHDHPKRRALYWISLCPHVPMKAREHAQALTIRLCTAAGRVLSTTVQQQGMHGCQHRNSILSPVFLMCRHHLYLTAAGQRLCSLGRCSAASSHQHQSADPQAHTYDLQGLESSSTASQ